MTNNGRNLNPPRVLLAIRVALQRTSQNPFHNQDREDQAQRRRRQSGSDASCSSASLQKRAPGTSATQRPQRPLVSELGPGGPSPEKLKSGKLKSERTSGRTQSSAGSSSPSASRSGEPARICSAIRPEFWRIATSIFAVISGLAFRNALEFSRPCPKRWLS
jgi:hypothetical protein